jgi:hypothetical protein
VLDISPEQVSPNTVGTFFAPTDEVSGLRGTCGPCACTCFQPGWHQGLTCKCRGCRSS